MQKVPLSAIVPFQACRDGSHDCHIQIFNPEMRQNPGKLRIHVLFTNPSDTRAALNAALRMAAELDSEIALIVPQIVPFLLPLDRPPVPLDFAGNQIRLLAESADAGSIHLQGYIYLCRNPIETLLQKLPAHSLIVIGAKLRWPFGKSKRLAKALRRNGHEVIVANHG